MLDTISKKMDFIYGQINHMKKYKRNFVAIHELVDNDIKYILELNNYVVTFVERDKKMHNIETCMITW